MKTLLKKHTIVNKIDNHSVFLTLELREKSDWWKERSFTGVHWPKYNWDAFGSCGQIIDLMPEYIQKLWDKYHLNGMSAWTVKQDEALEEYEKTGCNYNYSEACEYLKTLWLYEDNGVKYWHTWQFHANPEDEDIKNFFNSLRDDSEKMPLRWR